MRKTAIYTIIGILFCISIGGCLDVRESQVKIDLERNSGEVLYRDIVSDGETEDVLKGDFLGLVGIVYAKRGDTLESTTESSELYEEDGFLNGRRTFIINDMEKLLEDFDIKREDRGYVMKLSEGTRYAGGNGVYIESSAGRQVIWDRDSKVIEAELRSDATDRNVRSMLQYWKEWKKWDAAGGPDALSLMRQELGDALKPSKYDGTIDYCPDGTCLSFKTELATPGSFDRLSDFAYMYLYQISDDASLDGFKGSGGEYLKSILKRNMLECPRASLDEDARCALRNLADAYLVKVSTITYGEEDSTVTQIDLEEKLR